METFGRVEPDSWERAGEGFVKRVRFRTAGGGVRGPPKGNMPGTS